MTKPQLTHLQSLDHHLARFISHLSSDFDQARQAQNPSRMRNLNDTLVSAYRIRLQYQLTPYMMQVKSG